MLRPDKRDYPLLLALVVIALGLYLNLAFSFSENAPEQIANQCDPQTDHNCVQHELPKISFWQRTVDDPINLFTFVLAIFTVVLAATSIWQGILTRRSIGLAREEFLATHRPRVRVRWISGPNSAENDCTGFRVAIVNVGDSTATITGYFIGALFLDSDGAFVGALRLADEDTTEDIRLRVGQTHIVTRVSEAPVPQRDWDRIREEATNTFLVLDGWFTYADDLGLERTTSFARQYDGQRQGWRPFAPVAEQEYED